MKSIILAGGSGSRLYPMTEVISKQLQPIYDKPMIYYPLSILMLAGIKDILIISTQRDTPFMESLFGDGSRLGINIQYKVQESPKGLADAFIVGKEFLSGEDVTMILGDNLFYGDLTFYRRAIENFQSPHRDHNATIFGYHVDDPARYGVVNFDKQTNKVIDIEEKPEKPKSNYAIPGLYIFDKSVTERAATQKPSPRGELEITDLMESYLKEGQLKLEPIGRGVTWLDTGTPNALLEAANLISSIQRRQGSLVACLEEVAFIKGFIDKTGLENAIESLPQSTYRDYLNTII
ncbi:MAG: glucose-1-phosphate thymidylyltransferase [Bdellovibrionaceae bacterium]|nr:glucose-1-phosphate thymidylyltransferase [Pseudobdellovibrionaceae bacterium]|tara:strand:- start:49638 stop:50513 length:876 start_codon:yes stop_codon:yes gene_type:complete